MSVTLTSSGITFSDSTTLTTTVNPANNDGDYKKAKVGAIVFAYWYDSSQPQSRYKMYGETVSGSKIYIPGNISPSTTTGSLAYNTWFSLGTGDENDPYGFIRTAGADNGPMGSNTAGTSSMIEIYESTTYPFPGYSGYTWTQYGTWRLLSHVARHYVGNPTSLPGHTYFTQTMWVRIA
jgi:hypothetical protein